MGKIFTIIHRDLKSGLRDWLIISLYSAALIIALLLRLLLPNVNDAVLNVVFVEGADSKLVDFVEDYATVSFASDINAMFDRLEKTDDLYGVLDNRGFYEIIRQGNETISMENTLKHILNKYHQQELHSPIDIKFSDIGWKIAPLKLEGAILLILFTTVFGAMLIRLNTLDEKTNHMLSAIHVTPISIHQFIIAKGFLGFTIPLINSMGILLILDFYDFNYFMLFVCIVAIALISLVIGFGFGTHTREPIAAVSSMKLIFVLILVSSFDALYLPLRWHFVLFWSPFYWAYMSLHAILLNEATWGLVLKNISILISITALSFLGIRKKIQTVFK